MNETCFRLVSIPEPNDKIPHRSPFVVLWDKSSVHACQTIHLLDKDVSNCWESKTYRYSAIFVKLTASRMFSPNCPRQLGLLHQQHSAPKGGFTPWAARSGAMPQWDRQLVPIAHGLNGYSDGYHSPFTPQAARQQHHGATRDVKSTGIFWRSSLDAYRKRGHRLKIEKSTCNTQDLILTHPK